MGQWVCFACCVHTCPLLISLLSCLLPVLCITFMYSYCASHEWYSGMHCCQETQPTVGGGGEQTSQTEQRYTKCLMCCKLSHLPLSLLVTAHHITPSSPPLCAVTYHSGLVHSIPAWPVSSSPLTQEAHVVRRSSCLHLSNY